MGVEAVNGNIKSLLVRGLGYQNLRYLVLKAQRMAVTEPRPGQNSAGRQQPGFRGHPWQVFRRIHRQSLLLTKSVELSASGSLRRSSV